MNFDVLTPAQKNALTKIIEYRKTDSQSPMQAIFKTLGIQASTSNAAANRLGFKGIRLFLKAYENQSDPAVVTYQKKTYRRRDTNSSASSLKVGVTGGSVYIVVVPKSDLTSTLNELMKG